MQQFNTAQQQDLPLASGQGRKKLQVLTASLVVSRTELCWIAHRNQLQAPLPSPLTTQQQHLLLHVPPHTSSLSALGCEGFDKNLKDPGRQEGGLLGLAICTRKHLLPSSPNGKTC